MCCAQGGNLIDPRAIVDPSAEIGSGVEVGPWTIIGPDVTIGDSCWIGPHAIIKGPTVIGKRNKIFQFATVGEDSPALAYGGEKTTLIIGDNNVIREGVTIHRGLAQGKGSTLIGDNNLCMAYVHIGHDCDVGDYVIMANNASLAGHVSVGDHANLGGYSGILQFRCVGAYSHVSAFSFVVKDVPAYVTVAGNPALAVGMNSEGMRRRQLPKNVMRSLSNAYKVVYRKGLTVGEAAAALEVEANRFPEVRLFVDAVCSSENGIVRPRHEVEVQRRYL
jgi:UDP-N-acetylglucosamine acyltransferase